MITSATSTGARERKKQEFDPGRQVSGGDIASFAAGTGHGREIRSRIEILQSP